GFRAEQARARAEGRYLGLGLSSYVESTGRGPFEGATVRVEPSGKVLVLTGDTGAIALGIGTYASRTAVVAGNATSQAAAAVREKALRVAAQLLEAAPSDLDLVDGVIRVRGAPDRQMPLAQVARTLAAPPPAFTFPKDLEPGLEATTYWHPEGNAYAFGTHAAIVEVDAETGVVHVRRYVVSHDCG